MLQDALAHRPTEIDVLNGGIVREGERAGVPTPLHESDHRPDHRARGRVEGDTMTTRVGELSVTALSDGELWIPPDGLLNKAAEAWPPRVTSMTKG